MLERFQLQGQRDRPQTKLRTAHPDHGGSTDVRPDDLLRCFDPYLIDRALRNHYPAPPHRRLSLDIQLGDWQIGNMLKSILAIRALANERRLQILEWLKDPRMHFPPQADGDLVRDGVCAVLIARKLGVSQPTVSEHLKVLSQAGLVRSKRIKQWTFYKRDEGYIRKIKRTLLAKV